MTNPHSSLMHNAIRVLRRNRWLFLSGKKMAESTLLDFRLSIITLNCNTLALEVIFLHTSLTFVAQDVSPVQVTDTLPW